MWVELEGANQILHISERGQSTYVFIHSARIDGTGLVCTFYVRIQACTYARAREGANQMHKLHAGGQSERSEPISKMCMEMVRKNFLRIS